MLTIVKPPTKAQLKEAARKKYFEYVSVPQIAEDLGLPQKTVEKWVYGRKGAPPERSWKFQREQASQELMSHVYEEAGKHEITRIWGIGLPMIRKALEFRDKLTLPLTMDEAESLTRILTAFDKLRRLPDSGELPAGNLPSRAFTMDDLREAVLKDKFFNINLNVQVGDQGAAAKDVSPVPNDPFAPQEGSDE